MTLPELLAAGPLSYETARQYALVFSGELAARLAEVQGDDVSSLAEPRQLVDGRWMLCADLLTEVSPGGLYAAGFARLNPARFGEIEVVPWADAVDMLPPEDLSPI